MEKSFNIVLNPEDALLPFCLFSHNCFEWGIFYIQIRGKRQMVAQSSSIPDVWAV